ncbi:Ribonuclease 3 [Candidatus Hepatoplasma crinochetorum Av]|uniref:Ribonuclease 3 n=1 Tax=Candidatus Hepatoplasma crinochetorum Av TaxID=1427984 RepID=W8GG70_9MOLU|nr:ribonuclease III [Candidatus Hepatoplasma crinochetorum]AHK22583.1 Ribonuclease 3 [Candidatus Hepatoplasma crinochetorum Av]
MKNSFEDFLLKNGIKFKNINYYHIAFTHMSFSHESKDNAESYERLEFLGDSILGYIVGEYIFKNFKNLPPGEMTLIRSKHVDKTNLSKIGKKLQFEKYIYRGLGEQKNQPSDSVYEDVFESLIAAIYLDIGLKATKKFVTKNILIDLKKNLKEKSTFKDYKTRLQENLQADGGNTAFYQVIKQKREGNKNIFTVAVFHDNNKLGEGIGNSKKEAEQKAAKNAISKRVDLK